MSKPFHPHLLPWAAVAASMYLATAVLCTVSALSHGWRGTRDQSSMGFSFDIGLFSVVRCVPWGGCTTVYFSAGSVSPFSSSSSSSSSSSVPATVSHYWHGLQSGTRNGSALALASHSDDGDLGKLLGPSGDQVDNLRTRVAIASALALAGLVCGIILALYPLALLVRNHVWPALTGVAPAESPEEDAELRGSAGAYPRATAPPLPPHSGMGAMRDPYAQPGNGAAAPPSPAGCGAGAVPAPPSPLDRGAYTSGVTPAALRTPKSAVLVHPTATHPLPPIYPFMSGVLFAFAVVCYATIAGPVFAHFAGLLGGWGWCFWTVVACAAFDIMLALALMRVPAREMDVRRMPLFDTAGVTYQYGATDPVRSGV
eukprot:TRINITY_DN33431_c0_g1_i1.p1 TRINITY_DN33431_c0_g1~~TRINITY_DN33431_c0_g1_i1.p1  ORF type:complete len:426 (+),score=43.82 TRINITY_DN33431_c0_g1_i1:169-1278(+)